MNHPDGMETGRLRGHVAIVTGGAGGLGRACCRELLTEGATVVVVDHDAERVTATVNGLEEERHSLGFPGLVTGFALDVRREDDMNEMAALTRQLFGRIDVLVAAAGILRGQDGARRPLAQMSTQEWDQVIDTNLKGVFLSNRAVLGAMIEQRRGQIVNISSTAGRQGKAFDSAYSASKFGVIGLSESVAEEVSRYGIKVHVLLPDAVDTPLWQQNEPLPNPEAKLAPARVANLIMFLLTLPPDTILHEPVIAPFKPLRRLAAPRRMQTGEPSDTKR